MVTDKRSTDAQLQKEKLLCQRCQNIFISQDDDIQQSTVSLKELYLVCGKKHVREVVDHFVRAAKMISIHILQLSK
jgi:hypothetical protein